ncbi:unnamed protein product, partial [marine sediment metagenome]
TYRAMIFVMMPRAIFKIAMVGSAFVVFLGITIDASNSIISSRYFNTRKGAGINPRSLYDLALAIELGHQSYEFPSPHTALYDSK